MRITMQKYYSDNVNVDASVHLGTYNDITNCCELFSLVMKH